MFRPSASGLRHNHLSGGGAQDPKADRSHHPFDVLRIREPIQLTHSRLLATRAALMVKTMDP
jgi:hypothetical protein